jgi:hypothetical protein
MFRARPGGGDNSAGHDTAAACSRERAPSTAPASTAATSSATASTRNAAAKPFAVAAGLAAWIDDHREAHLARLELELAVMRDPRPTALARSLIAAGRIEGPPSARLTAALDASVTAAPAAAAVDRCVTAVSHPAGARCDNSISS